MINVTVYYFYWSVLPFNVCMSDMFICVDAIVDSMFHNHGKMPCRYKYDIYYSNIGSFGLI